MAGEHKKHLPGSKNDNKQTEQPGKTSQQQSRAATRQGHSQKNSAKNAKRKD
jgi:hypothetical protein